MSRGADAKHETNKLKQSRGWQTPALSFLTGMTDALPPVGFARATKGDVTADGEKFCEILRQISSETDYVTSREATI